MKYLIGKSKYSGNVYAGLVPDDCFLEPIQNREWQKEIIKAEFDKLNKSDPAAIFLSGIICEIYTVEGYE